VQYRFLDSNGTVLTAANANLNPTPDANGYFTEQVPAGSESASVSYSRIANSTLALPDNFTYQALLNVTGNMTVDLTIPSTTLTVNVVDPNGVPVAGAEVTVSEPWGGPPFWSVGTCTVPEGLSYSLCGITPSPRQRARTCLGRPARVQRTRNRRPSCRFSCSRVHSITLGLVAVLVTKFVAHARRRSPFSRCDTGTG
jgi:hypothetical protein